MNHQAHVVKNTQKIKIKRTRRNWKSWEPVNEGEWDGRACRRLREYPDAEEAKSANVGKNLNKTYWEWRTRANSDKCACSLRGDGRMRPPQRSPRKSAALMMFLVVLMGTIKDSTRLPINWLRSRPPVKATPADNSPATCSRAPPIG